MSEPAASTPRDWLADSPFPWPAPASLPDGAAVHACFSVLDVQLARTRTDQPYLRLTLGDRHGPLEARAWENAVALGEIIREGGYIGVRGRIEYFNGQLQLVVAEAVPLRVELDDLELFLPRSRRDAAGMDEQLESLIESVADRPLQALLRTLLAADSDVGRGFRLAPAAKFNHHAFLGGLLEHTLSVAETCDRLARHYGPAIDRDLLVAAALLHDIGKVREIGARAGFPYTDEGKLLGHIVLGIQMVAGAAEQVADLGAGRLLLLQHLIASHQGRFEWQSPREPSILEGIVLHCADDLDAKLQQVRELMERSPGGWTAYDRSFRREFLMHRPAAGAESASESPGPAGRAGRSRSLRGRSAAPAGPDPIPAEPQVDGHAPQAREAGTRFSGDTLDLFGGPAEN